MSGETLFEIEGKNLKKGLIYQGVATTVSTIQENESLASRTAGTCALALQLALEADNVDPSEKAYARTKIYDSLSKVLQDLNEAAGQTQTTGELAGVLAVILDPDSSSDITAGDDL